MDHIKTRPLKYIKFLALTESRVSYKLVLEEQFLNFISRLDIFVLSLPKTQILKNGTLKITEIYTKTLKSK